jgi:PGF-pre-PGF domain-containing protein
MSLESGSIYSAEVGPFTELTTITYWINATDNASQSTESSTNSFTVSDISGPTITIINPASDGTIYDTTPTIKASYDDPSDINISSVVLTIDGSVVTANITSSSVTYISSTPMTYGDHTIELDVSDSLGNIETKEWSFSLEETSSISEEELGNIASGDETEVIPENSEETGISVISFTAIDDLTDVKISVAKLLDKPEGVTELQTDVATYIFLNLEITSEGLSVPSTDMESLKIKFKVETSWMEDNNIDQSSIMLVRYNDGWEELTTTKISEDDNYVYYEATTPGLSTFAIVGTAITEEDASFPILYISIMVVIVAIILIIIILLKTGYIYIENDSSTDKKHNVGKKKK